MTQAVVAIQNGFKFQARHFWLKAAALLDPGGAVIRVGFESGPKSFDDVWVEYATGRGPRGTDRVEIRRMHFQCKWHESPGLFGYVDLADPEFIGAAARSFLGRAHDALKIFDGAGFGVGFSLVTNWRPNPNDGLRNLISKRTAALRIDQMFAGGPTSAMGGLRQAWQDHLGIDEIELRRLARAVRIEEATDSLETIRENLESRLTAVGLKRFRANESAFAYDDLAYAWLAQKKNTFDREGLRKLCREEGLFEGEDRARPSIFGIKSFVHKLDALEDRCDAVLDFTDSFHERQIITESSWADDVYPRLQAFLVQAAKGHPRLRLILDAHLSLAFAAGTVLDVKSGRAIELAQRTQSGEKIWSPDDAEATATEGALTANLVDLGNGADDLAVLLAITHDIELDVRKFVATATPSVGLLLVLKPKAGTGQQSVANGRHASDMADSAVAAIRSARAASGAKGPLHLFVASPASLSFFLGQRASSLGSITLYEFDFEGLNGGSYRPSLSLPVLPRPLGNSAAPPVSQPQTPPGSSS